MTSALNCNAAWPPQTQTLLRPLLDRFWAVYWKLFSVQRKAGPNGRSKLLDRTSVSVRPGAKKGPAITASRGTVVARTIVRAVKCAIAIDPARRGAPAPEAIAQSAFFTDDLDVFGQRRSRHRTGLIE